MKARRIHIEVSEETMEKLQGFVDKASNIKNPTRSFILQVFDNGTAKGLFLPKKEAEFLKPILQKLWDDAID